MNTLRTLTHMKKAIFTAIAVASLAILPATAQAVPITGTIDLVGAVRITSNGIDWLTGGSTPGGTTGDASGYSTLFLVAHVGLVLAAFAGFTLAAALSALYLWQERRLKRHEAGILRIRVPALVTLDDLAGRTIAFALPALTLGIVAGLVRLGIHGGGFDALMGVTILTWAVYGAFLLLRYEAGWHGRKAAYLLLAGFALVIAVRLGLPTVHFS